MIYLGTTGWDFKFWEKQFYPHDTEEKLEYYAQISAFTELRETYANIPSTDDVLRWYSTTPEKFMFISRMPRQITQSNRIKEEKIVEFFDIMAPLEYKHQMTLLHFSSKFQRSQQNTEYLTELIEKIGQNFSGQILVDIPNRSWQVQDIKKLLHEHSSCLVGQDKRPIPSLMKDPIMYYLRLLGDNRIVPRSMFGKKPLDRSSDLKYWADHLKFSDKKTETIFVALDNHFSGNAINDAFLLTQELRKRKVNVKGFKQG